MSEIPETKAFFPRNEIDCSGCNIKKQLKRLENEYEGFAVKYTDMEIALKAKEQEYEELKKSVRSNKDKRKRAIEKYLKLKEFTNKEFEKLKAEKNNQITKDNINDIFKKTIEHHKNNANMTAYEIDNRTYVIQLEKVIFRIREERDQLKVTLQEIKKIAEDDCKTCTVKLLGEDEINCKRCYKTKILQKCKEVLKDEQNM